MRSLPLLALLLAGCPDAPEWAKDRCEAEAIRLAEFYRGGPGPGRHGVACGRAARTPVVGMHVGCRQWACIVRFPDGVACAALIAEWWVGSFICEDQNDGGAGE